MAINEMYEPTIGDLLNALKLDLDKNSAITPHEWKNYSRNISHVVNELLPNFFARNLSGSYQSRVNSGDIQKTNDMISRLTSLLEQAEYQNVDGHLETIISALQKLVKGHIQGRIDDPAVTALVSPFMDMLKTDNLLLVKEDDRIYIVVDEKHATLRSGLREELESWLKGKDNDIALQQGKF